TDFPFFATLTSTKVGSFLGKAAATATSSATPLTEMDVVAAIAAPAAASEPPVVNPPSVAPAPASVAPPSAPDAASLAGSGVVLVSVSFVCAAAVRGVCAC